jgi:hypothetical protein
MDSMHQALIGALRSIRDQADSVLKKIEHGAEQKSPCFEVRCLRSHETFHASG